MRRTSLHGSKVIGAIVAALLAGSWSPASGFTRTTCHAMRFEHIGPEDASGPPFVIAAGAAAQSTPTQFLVDQETCWLLRAMVKQISEANLPVNAPVGTFVVTSLGFQKTIVRAAGMRSIVSTLRRSYAAQRVAVPPLLSIWENLLNAEARQDLPGTSKD